MPSRPFTAREEKSMSSFKIPENKLTLLLKWQKKSFLKEMPLHITSKMKKVVKRLGLALDKGEKKVRIASIKSLQINAEEGVEKGESSCTWWYCKLVQSL